MLMFLNKICKAIGIRFNKILCCVAAQKWQKGCGLAKIVASPLPPQKSRLQSLEMRLGKALISYSSSGYSPIAVTVCVSL